MKCEVCGSSVREGLRVCSGLSACWYKLIDDETRTPHMIVTYSEPTHLVGYRGVRWFASCDCGKVEGTDAVDARRAMEGRCKERPIQRAIRAMEASRA